MALNVSEGQTLGWGSALFRSAVTQFDRVAEQIDLAPNLAERLRVPQRSLVVTFLFRRDEYSQVDTVYGYRV
jgi:glutamate dehydrogenase (NAD(P)+)